MQNKDISSTELREKLHDLFEKLNEEDQALVEEHLTIHTYAKNDIIYHEGERPTHLYCLLSGKIKIFKEGVGGRNQTVRLVCPGEYFGLRAYLSGENFITVAGAYETSTIAKVPLQLLEHIIRSNNDIAWYLVQRFAIALGKADERMVSLTQKHIRGRLAESLLYIKERYGTEEDGQTLSSAFSREDIANLSNMTTSNAIRTLSSFATDGLIKLNGRKITLTDEKGLQKISRLG